MKKTLLSTSIAALALSSAIGAQAEGFDKVLSDTKVDLNFRYRVESADQDDATNKDTALANTLKSRLTIKTGEVSGLSVLVEADNVLHVTDDFNDQENGNTTHDVVLDQETTQFNQAFIQYVYAGTTVKAGNQRINLDNQRHVGGVAFRQDEATFDAISVKNTDIENTTIFLALSNNQNNIKNENTENDVSLLNVKYKINSDLAATGYYYDIKDSGTTIGTRVVGQAAGIGFEAELATQDQDATDASPLYYHVAANKKLGSVKLTAGLEVLGSDDGNGSFGTPLGTNHKFLGWTDGYLQTKDGNGLQDLYITAVTNVSDVKLVGQVHSFSPDNGNLDLGTEVGFLAATKIKNYGVSIKVAQLTGSDLVVDTTKVWLTGSAKF